MAFGSPVKDIALWIITALTVQQAQVAIVAFLIVFAQTEYGIPAENAKESAQRAETAAPEAGEYSIGEKYCKECQRQPENTLKVRLFEVD